MDGIFTAVMTVVGALAGATIPITFNYFVSKKARRIHPFVSIWDDRFDDIDAKIKETNDTWICSFDKILELNKLSHYYFNFMISQNYCLNDCTAQYFIYLTDGSKKESKVYELGSLLPDKGYVLPVAKIDNISKIEFELKYKNENNESIRYLVVVEIDLNNQRLKSVEKIAYKINKKSKEKKLRSFKINIADTFAAKAIEKKLNGVTLNKMELNNGDNNTSQPE